VRVGVNSLFLIPREVGGTEVHLRNVMEALGSLDEAPELVVFTNRENHETFQDYERVAMDVAAVSRPRRILAEQLSLPRATARAAVDVLYSPGYTAPRRVSCPQVVTIYDTQFLDFPEDLTWTYRQAHRLVVGMSARAADVVTTLSEYGKSRVVANLGVPSRKVLVTGSGLSGHFAVPHDSPVAPPFLLYVANTYPHKNAVRLVKAFATIASLIPHALVIVGQPRGGEPPAHPRVQRLHRVSFPDLVGLMQAAELMVFPSLYEGFGRPVVEAQEAGTRVIASQSACIPEIAGEGATYFNAESEEAIGKAILDALREPPEQREQHVAAGRRNSVRFSWEDTARKTLEAFQVAASSRP
jgi:glycosyltransferase involved in cell wall biosynthesis